MPTATITKNYAIPGYVTTQIVLTRTADNAIIYGGSDAPITCYPAFAITSFTEGSPNEATGNIANLNGQTSGVYDVYWLEGGVKKIRRSVDVVVTVNAVAITVGVGDDYPTTPISPILCKQKAIAAHIDGDAVSVLWASLKFGNVAATGRGHIEFQKANATPVGTGIAIDGVAGGIAVAELDITGGQSNVITGDVIDIANVTHNDILYAPTFEMSVVQDSTQ